MRSDRILPPRSELVSLDLVGSELVGSELVGSGLVGLDGEAAIFRS
jgi:hypothetical protein